jgi:hypothetical protein
VGDGKRETFGSLSLKPSSCSCCKSAGISPLKNRDCSSSSAWSKLIGMGGTGGECSTEHCGWSSLQSDARLLAAISSR